MMKSVIASLLVVVLLFSFHYAIADDEFDQLLKEYQQLQDIQKVIKNGLRIYPENGWEAEYGFKSDTILPDISEENYKEYVGTTYLLTGTCLKRYGFGCTFQLDDGRVLLINFDIYEDGEYTSFFPAPYDKTRCNLYCTFDHWYHDSLYKTDLSFHASVTEKAVQYAIKHYGD